MLNLDAIPERIREWAEKDLLPHLQQAEARIKGLEGDLATLKAVAEEYAALGLAAAQRELARLQAEAPAAAALIEDAEAAVARWQALVAKLEGAPSGM